MRRILCFLWLCSAVLSAQAQSYEKEISPQWKTKVIKDVPSGSIDVLLECFDRTWPTEPVGDVCQVLPLGVTKKLLDDSDGYTVEVDRKNGYVESYTEGSDRTTMSACVWRRTNGHRLFAVLISSPTDPAMEWIYFYDYSPNLHTLTPEPDIMEINILPLFPASEMYYVLPKKGTDFIVTEYNSGADYKRTYKWDGMTFEYVTTERIPLDFGDEVQQEEYPEMPGGNNAGPGDMSFAVAFKGQQPTISDFITAILAQEDIGEALADVGDNWDLRRQGKRLEQGASFTVDERNGFIRFDHIYADTGEAGYTEFCYWNCADGRHKLVCANTGLYVDGKPSPCQNCGLFFYLYDNETRRLTYTDGNELGTGVHVTSPVTFHLPRQGKDIRAEIHGPNGLYKIVMQWKGQKFEQEHIK